LGRRETFVYLVIKDKPLWPERVPGGEQCDGEQRKGEVSTCTFSFLLRNKNRLSMSVVEYAALVNVVMQLCAVGTDCPVNPQKAR